MPDFTGVRFDNSKRKARSVKALPKALFFVRSLNNPQERLNEAIDCWRNHRPPDS
jgi:hypothetical protein